MLQDQFIDVNCTCDFHPNTTVVFGLEICNISIVGSWVIAVFIGLTCGSVLGKFGPSVVGSLSYSLSYYTYAVMITSGLVVHSLYLVECGNEPPDGVWRVFANIDGSLTSCIAMSFFFNALVDLKVIVERQLLTYLAMFVTYWWIFHCYFSGNNFLNIYSYSILFGCGFYVIVQVYLIAKQKLWGDSLWLIMSGIVGGGCFVLIRFYSCWLCHSLGAWSVQGIWYYGSDASMALLFVYIRQTRRTSCWIVD